LLQTIDHHSDV